MSPASKVEDQAWLLDGDGGNEAAPGRRSSARAEPRLGLAVVNGRRLALSFAAVGIVGMVLLCRTNITQGGRTTLRPPRSWNGSASSRGGAPLSQLHADLPAFGVPPKGQCNECGPSSKACCTPGGELSQLSCPGDLPCCSMEVGKSYDCELGPTTSPPPPQPEGLEPLGPCLPCRPGEVECCTAGQLCSSGRPCCGSDASCEAYAVPTRAPASTAAPGPVPTMSLSPSSVYSAQWQASLWSGLSQLNGSQFPLTPSAFMNRAESRFEGIVVVFGGNGDGSQPARVRVSVGFNSGSIPLGAHGWYAAASTCYDAGYMDCYDAAPRIRYQARCVGGAFIHDDLPLPLCHGGEFSQEPVLIPFDQPQAWLEVRGFPVSIHIGCGAYDAPHGTCGGSDALVVTSVIVEY